MTARTRNLLRFLFEDMATFDEAAQLLGIATRRRDPYAALWAKWSREGRGR